MAKDNGPMGDPIEDIRRQLLAGIDPMVAGEADGLRNLPKPGARQPAEFEMQVAENAMALANREEEVCQGHIAFNIETFRSRPAPQPEQDIRKAEQTHAADLTRIAGEWKERLKRSADLKRIKRQELGAIVHAIGKHPPSDRWPTLIDFVFVLALCCALEGFVSWALLEEALGDAQSVMFALAFTLATEVLGVLGGVGALKGRSGPAENLLEAIRRHLTWITLSVMVLFQLLLAGFRALKIEGSEGPLTLKDVLLSPLHAAGHWETWLLLIVAAAVYAACAWKSFKFWGGAIDLRETDMARLAADAGWEEEKSRYQRTIHHAGDQALQAIDEVVGFADEWARAAANFRDEILGAIFTANRKMRTIASVAATAIKSYRAANGAARDEAEPAGWSDPISVDVPEVTVPNSVPDLATHHADRAIQARAVGEAARVAIRAAEKDIIDNLDTFFAAAQNVGAPRAHAQPAALEAWS